MGCDIHVFAERKVNGRWVTADTWEDKYGEGLSVPYGKSFYHSRNYDLFSILADVRNGRGFAGVKTGEGFNPIDAPRGIPADACKEYREASDAYGCDGHSHSWMTVSDLHAFDWTQVTTKQGIVGLSEFARWKVSGKPHAWSGGIWGASIEIFDSARGVSAVEKVINAPRPEGERIDWYTFLHMGIGGFRDADDATIKAPQKVALTALRDELGCSDPRFTVQWQIPYYEAAGTFLSETLPRLWRLGAPDDVRLCFFFDN